MGAGASLDATHVTVAANGITGLHWDAGSTGSLFNSAVADDPIVIDPAVGVLSANCNAIPAATAGLGGTNDVGLTAASFTPGTRSPFEVDSTSALLFQACPLGLIGDIDNTDRSLTGPDAERGAYDAP